MILLGIDAGSGQHCGIAVYHTQTRLFLRLEAGHLLDVLDWLDKESPRLSGIVLEDANLDSTTFRKGATPSLTLKIAQDTGKNKAIATILKEKCRRLGLPILLVAPSQRRRADKSRKPLEQLPMPTKLSQEQFEALTGCTLSANEHCRDAAMLVWKMSLPEFRKHATFVIDQPVILPPGHPDAPPPSNQ